MSIKLTKKDDKTGKIIKGTCEHIVHLQGWLDAGWEIVEEDKKPTSTKDNNLTPEAQAKIDAQKK
jgi:hypothetical protein